MHHQELSHLYSEIESRIDEGEQLESVERSIRNDDSIPACSKYELCEWAWAWSQSRLLVSMKEELDQIPTLTTSLR